MKTIVSITTTAAILVGGLSAFTLSRTPNGLRRGQLAVIAVLLALALIAWLVTGIRMAGMDGGPGTDPGTVGFYVSTWAVMMAAMMFPSIAPVVLTYRRMNAVSMKCSASTLRSTCRCCVTESASGCWRWPQTWPGRPFARWLFATPARPSNRSRRSSVSG